MDAEVTGSMSASMPAEEAAQAAAESPTAAKRAPPDAPLSPARHKRRKQAAPLRIADVGDPSAPPLYAPPAAPPNAAVDFADFHAKMADMYANALAFGADLGSGLPAFPNAAGRPPHEPLRIFNPEAYCELCCKEFCNKYFLKTHKANKHGIYENNSAPGDALPPQALAALALNSLAQPDELFLQTFRRSSDEEGLLRQSDDSMPSIHSASSAPRKLSPDSCRRAKESGFNAETLRRLGVVNPEAFCELCCKEYCNKYFLKTHKEKRHGAAPSLSPPPRQLLPPIEIPTFEIKREEEEPQPERDGQTSPLNLIVEERGGVPNNVNAVGEELRKLQTMISQLNELAVGRGGGNVVATCRACRRDFESSTALQLHVLAEHASRPPSAEAPPVGAPVPPQGAPPPPSAPPAPPERQSGSSFCDICNKELCNKYFMKTHMQRMHGIEIENGAQLGGVQCDICHKELCSKYFLRVHKHNTHGIGDGAPLQANANALSQGGPAEQCPLCPRRFKAGRGLRAHLLSEHGREPWPDGEPQQPPPALELFSEKSYTCSYCPFATSTLAFLFAHEKSHTHDWDGEPQPEDQTESFECSRCEFKATTFAAMEAHLRARHAARRAPVGGGGILAVPRPPQPGPPISPVTMQPFVLEEPGGCFVPSLVFLPVRKKATRRATVTFTLTPA